MRTSKCRANGCDGILHGAEAEGMNRVRYICDSKNGKHVFRLGWDGQGGTILIGETPDIKGNKYEVTRDELPS
jgi:hypothetical protein